VSTEGGSSEARKRKRGPGKEGALKGQRKKGFSIKKSSSSEEGRPCRPVGGDEKRSRMLREGHSYFLQVMGASNRRKKKNRKTVQQGGRGNRDIDPSKNTGIVTAAEEKEKTVLEGSQGIGGRSHKQVANNNDRKDMLPIQVCSPGRKGRRWPDVKEKKKQDD